MKTVFFVISLFFCHVVVGQVPNVPLQLTPSANPNPFDPNLPETNMKPVFTWEHDPLADGYEVYLHRITADGWPTYGSKYYEHPAEFFGCADTCLLSLDIFDAAEGSADVSGWGIRAYNNSGYSAWSPWGVFRVIRPRITAPASGQLLAFPVPNTPTYGWAKGRGDQGMRYDLEVHLNNAFLFRLTSQQASCGIENCTLRPNRPLNAGDYTVRVRERFGATVGDWSWFSYFRVGV